MNTQNDLSVGRWMRFGRPGATLLLALASGLAVAQDAGDPAIDLVEAEAQPAEVEGIELAPAKLGGAYPSDGNVFVVDAIDFDFSSLDLGGEDLLLDELFALALRFTEVETVREIEDEAGFTVEDRTTALALPRRGRKGRVDLTLGALPGGTRMHGSALVEVMEAVRTVLEERTGLNLYVIPAPQMIQFSWDSTLGAAAIGEQDFRGGATTLTLKVFGEDPEPQIDAESFEVTGLAFKYPFALDDEVAAGEAPELDEFFGLTVELSETPTGWIRPRPGMAGTSVPLSEIGRVGSTSFYVSAITAISETVRQYISDEYDLIGHFVTPSPIELEIPLVEGGRVRDLRPDGQTELTIEIYRTIVADVRTVGRGERWDTSNDDNENERAHRRISKHSPLEAGDLLSRRVLDKYVGGLNRHPGRRVDAALASAGTGGLVSLDYVISEPKPWFVFYQASNTGTEETGDVRHQVGLVHNQLTNNDDVLRVDYITSGFDDTNAVIGSYEFPLFDAPLRGRLFGTYSEFLASDVGVGLVDFEGESFTAGGELIWNLYQDREWFVDAKVGARYEKQRVDDITFALEGEERFLYVTAGVEFGRLAPTSSTIFSLDVDVLLPDVTAVSTSDLVLLGRTAPDRQTNTLRFAAQHNFFLEPLLNPRGFRGDRSADEQTLAHEVLLLFRGQNSFDKRLIPTQQQTAGGFFTVRGYDEALLVGDDAYIGTAEYAFHIGRALPQADSVSRSPDIFGRGFRGQRTTPYGGADWDLILRGFVDVASVQTTDAFAFEAEDTMVGVGIGAEFQLRQNLSARVDWGIALTDVESSDTENDAGSNRFHFLVSVRF
ncbi:MAG: ShlB/FhaC/HecB family hemolysin secretion/activation protein [Planctomycetota bacterium]